MAVDVLLVSTYELGHQPLGLAAPLAHLHAAGISARAIDAAVEPLPDAALAAADVVAISVPMHTALRLAVPVAARVRRLNPRAHICFYGLYAALNAAYLLRTCADSVIGGEVEEPLVRLVRRLAGSAGPDERVITFLGRPAYLPPHRDGLPPLSRYAHLVHGERLALAGCVEASRGCAHHCRHCPIPPVYGGRLRVIPVDVVLADAHRLAALGATHLTFADPDFFNGVRHSMAVLRALHAALPHLTFDLTVKIEHLIEHQALLPELRDLGCLFIVSAVESLSDAVLAALDKGHTAADVVTALALTRRAGIRLRPSLLPFTPWATLDDYCTLLEFVAVNDLVADIDPVQYAIRLLVPPGSSLLDTPAMQPYLGPLEEEVFAYRWRHPDPRMDALAGEVAALVEDAARRHEAPERTFAAIRALAREAGGRPRGRVPRVGVPALPGPSPRLTEPWFC